MGPILFNIYINDIFLYITQTDICNYADDNSLYVCDSSLQMTPSRLQNNTIQVINWFDINLLVVNANKFQFMILGNINFNDDVSMKVKHITINTADSIKLLGINIDKKLTFSDHIQIMWKKANKKINALCRIRKWITIDKARILYNAYILSCFSYCPIVWMFCNKMSNNLIDKTHKRALRVVYNCYDKSLEELLQIDGSLKIHQRNLRTLMIEVFKSINK